MPSRALMPQLFTGVRNLMDKVAMTARDIKLEIQNKTENKVS